MYIYIYILIILCVCNICIIQILSQDFTLMLIISKAPRTISLARWDEVVEAIARWQDPNSKCCRNTQHLEDSRRLKKTQEDSKRLKKTQGWDSTVLKKTSQNTRSMYLLKNHPLNRPFSLKWLAEDSNSWWPPTWHIKLLELLRFGDRRQRKPRNFKTTFGRSKNRVVNTKKQ